MREHIAAVLVACALALVVAPNALANGEDYVAMGDSYSSGTGTNDYFDASCERSDFAYGSLIKTALGGTFRMTACGGAVTNQITTNTQNGNPPQADLLGSGTDYVSLTIGGNDAGFSSTLLSCGEPLVSCQSDIDSSRTTITNTLPGRLDSVLSTIKTKAPNARIAIVSYPRIFPADGNDCSAATFFSSDEISQLNAMADLLADTTRAAALRNHVTFVDSRGAFLGHAWCEDEWINGLSNPTSNSYHPNKSGHSLGFQGIVREALLAAPARSFARGPNARLVFARAGDIWVANGDGSFATDVTPLTTGSTEQDPEFSPDGTKIVFASNRDGTQDIWKMNIDGSGLQKLTATTDIDTQPSWSPNAASIVFQRGGEIYRMKADGTGQTRLTNNTAAESTPAWSPDGAEIAYERAGEIYRMEGDGQGQWNLTNNAAADSQPVWSPDGAKIAFVRSGNVFTMTSGGGSQTQIATGVTAPSYSPDGTQIAGVKTNQIFTMTTSGGAQTARTAGTDATPSWQGDQTPPETTITSPKPSAVTTSTPSVTFSGTESGTTFECKVGSGAYGACSSPFSPSPLADGSRSITVRARDAAGNVDPTPDAWSFVVDTTSAATTITSGPSGPLQSTSASFAFSSDDPTATFQCSLDGAGFTACASPKGYTGLAQGSHTFSVRSVDPVGHVDPDPPARSFVVDTIAPTVGIAFGPAALSNVATPAFQLTASEPGVSFQCRLSGTAGGLGTWQACESPKTYAALPDGANYFFEVQGTDAAGNASGVVSYTPQFTIDTQAPAATITDGPSPGTPLLVSSATFTFGSDDAGASFQCRLDSADEGAWAPCSSPKTFTGLSQGSHHVEVRALDQAGNVQEIPATSDFAANVADPQIAYTSFPANPSDELRPSIGWTSSDDEATFECSLDGAGYTSCSSPFVPDQNLAQGSHTFDLRATDAFGDVVNAPQRTWAVDTTLPDTTIASGPEGFTKLTSASFTGSSEDPNPTFECALDGAPTFGGCSFSALADGEHTVRMRARDTAGNVDPSPATRTWTVDTTAPPVAVAGGPSAPTSETTASFDVSSTESGSTFQCSADGATFVACSLPLTGLADGPHTFRARAVDRAGNIGAPSTPLKTWTVDTTAPDATIDHATYLDTSAQFFFFAGESGAALECRLDGADWTTCTSPGPIYSALADGSHTFDVRARDAVGNVDATPDTRTWIVNPPATIDSGPSTPVSSTSATFGVTPANAQCSLDGGAFGTCSFSGLGQGPHTVKARATDLVSGRTTRTASQPARTWTVDTVAPDTTLTGGPAGTVSAATATFTPGSTEAGATLACSLDNAAFGVCAFPLTNLADGAHTLRVQATDAAGNADPTPASRTWTVDTTPPDTTLAASIDGTRADFTFTGDVAFECSLDGAAFTACTSPASLTVGQGDHAFRARAKDAAGNVDPSPAQRAWSVDTIAPVTTIAGTPDGFTFTASEAVTGFECSLDGGAFAPCVSGTSFAGLPAGDHALRVRSRDGAGNLGEAATRGWTVEAPVVEPPTPPVTPVTPVQPRPPVAVPVKVSFAKGSLKLPSSGRVTVATVACGSLRCAVTTAAKPTVKLGRTTYTLAASAPRTLAPGTTGAVTISVPSKLRKALKGKTISLPVQITVAEAGGKKTAPRGTVKLRG